MKFGFLLLLLSISFLTFSENTVQAYEPLDVERVVADLDTIKMEMDSTFYYISETCKILLEEVELLGLKKTIQMNSGIFFPYVIVAVLYILWLLKRKK
jgi:hypothetical protein